MKFNFFLFFALFFFTKSFTQDTMSRVFIPIKTYKEKYNKPLTKKDSLSFMYRDNDTLVLVKNFVRPKGKSVPYEYKDSLFLKYYKKVAFNNNSDSLRRKTSMKYWKGDIKMFFSKSVSKKTKKEVLSFAKKIAKNVDSLNIYEVKRVEQSNYIIYYFGDYNYESKMNNYKFSDYSLYWNENKIYKGSIKIDPKVYFNDNLMTQQLKTYFVLTLGWFQTINDFDCESYFSNCYSLNKHLTALDLEIIKYHYSYGICKGTNLETFENQHKRAKETLKKTGRHTSFFHEE